MIFEGVRSKIFLLQMTAQRKSTWQNGFLRPQSLGTASFDMPYHIFIAIFIYRDHIFIASLLFFQETS